jgi:two-component system cell cycle sensor histidine kinase/response regulator CckA
MRVRLPLRTRLVPPSSAPALRYFVAVLSTTLALIPALLFSDVFESRLLVFAVAVMVSAWYGGWKPGLVATAFALTLSAWFSLHGTQTTSEYQRSVIHLALFAFVALLICWFNAALRSAQEGLRQSEINFRSLVTNAPYGICRVETNGRLLDVNPALVALLGCESPSEVVGRNLANFYREAKPWTELTEHFRTGRDFHGLVAEWTKTDGSVAAVRLSGRGIREKEQEAQTFEIFAEDVTERRALEQQLRQSQKMEAIGRLAGGIAHDFNNLLMVISGYAELLLERAGSDEALREPAREIGTAAGRATSLTRQLLAFSRKQMLDPRVLDLNGVVTENLKMLTRLIGEDIELIMVPGTGVPMVKADPGQIEQVILNLAVNARDAMPRGGKLTIETADMTLDESYARFHPPVQPGEYAMLAISDTGQGMDADTQSHIFEPFFTTKGPKGTGLGLSTVYGIIKQSGGYIWVYSELGQGTTFKIYLPRVPATSAAAVALPERTALPAPVSETILVVEDEANLRRLARDYLRRQGYTVLEAGDGASAIAEAAVYRGPIHLLLTDVIMPGMNGRELAQRVGAMRPGIKVLYMSGYTENVIGHNGMLSAGIALLPKPFTLRDLQQKVREVLGSAPEVLAGTATEERETNEAHMPSRAQRFSLHLPLRYRVVGEPRWRAGSTENISRSGLLFRAEEMVELNSRVEISLVLPAEIGGLSATEVFCKGEVVRAQEEAAIHPALAAKILQYHFHHGGAVA